MDEQSRGSVTNHHDTEIKRIARIETRLKELNDKSTQMLLFLTFGLVAAATLSPREYGAAATGYFGKAMTIWAWAIFPVLLGVLPVKELYRIRVYRFRPFKVSEERWYECIRIRLKVPALILAVVLSAIGTGFFIAGLRALPASSQTRDGAKIGVNLASPQPNQQTAPPQQDTNHQEGETLLGFSPAAWSAAFTVVIAFAAIIQILIYFGMLGTGKVVERAWVSLESLEIIRGATIGDRTVIVGLKNSGRMPATIIDANISFAGLREGEHGKIVPIDNLPPTPTYRPGEFAFPTLLVAGEVSRWDYSVPHMGDEQFAVLMASPGDERKLWVYGYVHYTDPLSPNKTRKYGWAREYDWIRSNQANPKGFKFRYVNNPAYNYAD